MYPTMTYFLLKLRMEGPMPEYILKHCICMLFVHVILRWLWVLQRRRWLVLLWCSCVYRSFIQVFANIDSLQRLVCIGINSFCSTNVVLIKLFCRLPTVWLLVSEFVWCLEIPKQKVSLCLRNVSTLPCKVKGNVLESLTDILKSLDIAPVGYWRTTFCRQQFSQRISLYIHTATWWKW